MDPQSHAGDEGSRGGGGVGQLRVCSCFVRGFGRMDLALCPSSPPMFASSQRQRLRELLIRQQIQRNNLRQEKESAAAAATPSPSGWAPDSSSQPYELSRTMTTYQPPQVGWRHGDAARRLGVDVWGDAAAFSPRIRVSWGRWPLQPAVGSCLAPSWCRQPRLCRMRGSPGPRQLPRRLRWTSMGGESCGCGQAAGLGAPLGGDGGSREVRASGVCRT